MSEKVSVSAEHSYDVLIGCNWKDELTSRASGHTRCAIITTETSKREIASLSTALSLMEKKVRVRMFFSNYGIGWQHLVSHALIWL
jgi:hypothetical protein